MTLPVASFFALPTGADNLSLFDQQFAAISACLSIPCTAAGSNAVLLTPAANTPTISVYTNLTPKFVWTQAQTSTGAVTIQITGGLAAVHAYRNNGQTSIGSGDLVAGASYTGFYLSTLNSGAGGFVVNSIPASATSGNLISLVNYTTGGSATITIPNGASKGYVRMWGASGGSGGVAAGGTAGGTGAGGYLEKLLTGLTPANTLTYTQGAAGPAGSAAPGNGGDGSVTTLASGTQTIGTLTCNSSTGGLAASGAGVFTIGTPGGSAGGGDFNANGPPGTVIPAVGGIPGYNLFSVGAFAGSGAGGGFGGNTGGMIIAWFT